MPVKRLPWFRLRTILLLMHLLVLIVPLGSIYGFGLYENELVRQTESELIAQGAFIAVLYKQALLPLLPVNGNYGPLVKSEKLAQQDKYSAIEPVLDLSHVPLLPPRPNAVKTTVSPDAKALQAADAIFPVIEAATLATLAGVRLMDFHGVVVGGREEKGLSLAKVEEVAAALQGRYEAALRQRLSKHATPPLGSLSRGSHLRIFVAMPVTDGNRLLGVVYLSRSPRNMLKGLFDNLQAMELAGALVLVVTVLLALITSYAISRPIHALIAQTQRIGRGEKSVAPIDMPVTSEIALLSEHIAQMAKTLSERSDYIHRFAMQVSHEFKTPLTAIQGAIELIGEHGGTMSREQLAKFLGNTVEDTQRLGKLVTRLLEMARADMMEPRQECSDLAEILGQMQCNYQDKGLSIVCRLTGATELPLPTDIMQTVLTNLFENSLQHGASEIYIEMGYEPFQLQVTLLDNGIGISPGNSRKLFTPFFTTARGTGGTGLGLVIIQSLLQPYKARIAHKPTLKGACFVLFIPRE